MTAWWQLFSRGFSPQECQWLRDYAAKLQPIKGTIGHGGKTAVDKMRESTVRWIPRDDPALLWFYLRIERMALQANANAFGLNITGQAGGFHELQFTEYHGSTEAPGHYDWHEDNCWKPDPTRGTPKAFDRKMSMVLQLSRPDEYQGGRLELQHDNIGPDVFTQQGDTIFFPSHLRHRVTDCTEGTRFSLVTWFVGPRMT